MCGSLDSLRSLGMTCAVIPSAVEGSALLVIPSAVEGSALNQFEEDSI
jgi:hypothetical protein